MSDLQVLLDGRGVTRKELITAVGTLLRAVRRVEVLHVEDQQLEALTDEFGDRVVRARPLRRDVAVLVAPARVAFAPGSLRRILADLATPGRCVTCVLVQGTDGFARIACWAPAWLAGYDGSAEELAAAGLEFDREHLPTESPVARAWLRTDAVGVASVTDSGPDPQQWARRTELALRRAAVAASVRAPLGVARRRLQRTRQRRRQAGPAQSVR